MKTSAGRLRYLEVVRTLAQRDFIGRYRGNTLGALTTLLVPLLLLATYGFVFSKLIPIRLSPDATRADYVFFLFSGLVGWNLVTESIGRAPRLFPSHAHFVRKAGFPSSALPVATTLTAFYHSLLWLAVFAGARLTMGEPLAATLLLAPLALVLIAVFAAGIVLLVATCGVFVRDLAELVGPALMLGLFFSPILYPAERIADLAPWLVSLNPMMPLLDLLRSTALEGRLPTPFSLASGLAWGIVILAAGALVYHRIRPTLADVV